MKKDEKRSFWPSPSTRTQQLQEQARSNWSCGAASRQVESGTKGWVQATSDGTTFQLAEMSAATVQHLCLSAVRGEIENSKLNKVATMVSRLQQLDCKIPCRMTCKWTQTWTTWGWADLWPQMSVWSPVTNSDELNENTWWQELQAGLISSQTHDKHFGDLSIVVCCLDQSTGHKNPFGQSLNSILLDLQIAIFLFRKLLAQIEAKRADPPLTLAGMGKHQDQHLCFDVPR